MKHKGLLNDDIVAKTIDCPHCRGTGRMVAEYVLRPDMQGTSTRTAKEQFWRNAAFKEGTPISLTPIELLE